MLLDCLVCRCKRGMGQKKRRKIIWLKTWNDCYSNKSPKWKYQESDVASGANNHYPTTDITSRFAPSAAKNPSTAS